MRVVGFVCCTLFSSQAASEKREAMEKKLRAKLEDEVKELRAEQESREGKEKKEGEENAELLTRKLREYEEKVCHCVI